MKIKKILILFNISLQPNQPPAGILYLSGTWVWGMPGRNELNFIIPELFWTLDTKGQLPREIELSKYIFSYWFSLIKIVL